MKRLYWIITLYFMTFTYIAAAQARDFVHTSESYKAAKNAPSFLRFEMASTKLGLITTEFTGYVKKFKASANENSTNLENVTLQFEVADMDTDIDGRNDKMWDTCLDYKKHPGISVKLLSSVPLDGSDTTVPAIMDIRGQQKNIELHVRAKREANILSVDLSSEVSLKDLGIPDPSIVIATVRDKVILRAHLDVTP